MVLTRPGSVFADRKLRGRARVDYAAPRRPVDPLPPELGTRGPRPLPLCDVGGPGLAPERRAAPLERQGPPGDLQRVGMLLRDEWRLGRVRTHNCR